MNNFELPTLDKIDYKFNINKKIIFNKLPDGIYIMVNKEIEKLNNNNILNASLKKSNYDKFREKFKQLVVTDNGNKLIQTSKLNRSNDLHSKVESKEEIKIISKWDKKIVNKINLEAYFYSNIEMKTKLGNILNIYGNPYLITFKISNKYYLICSSNDININKCNYMIFEKQEINNETSNETSNKTSNKTSDKTSDKNNNTTLYILIASTVVGILILFFMLR